MNPSTSAKTPLYQQHVNAGAKLVEFAGFMMPIQYRGVIAEHIAVRSSVGLFDVSHMGQIEIKGSQAVSVARRFVTNDVNSLTDGQILYSPICYPDGGIVDDCLVYRLAENHVLMVVNASNIAKDFAWLKENAPSGVDVINTSDTYALLALQGPKACDLLSKLGNTAIRDIPSFTFIHTQIAGIDCMPSRTGYTGEDGFEIACSPNDAPNLWEQIMKAGAIYNIQSCGLGSRDTLRLEARLPLYGNDIDKTTSPLEAGLGWTVKLKQREFIGRDALLKQKKNGLSRKMVCLILCERGIARHGYSIFSSSQTENSDKAIGSVTSGTMAPFLGKAIALAYVPSQYAELGTRVWVAIRGKAVEAEVVKGPFYKRNV